MRLGAHRVDHRVGAAPIGHVQDLERGVAVVRPFDRLGAEPPGQLEPLRDEVDRDDPR